MHEIKTLAAIPTVAAPAPAVGCKSADDAAARFDGIGTGLLQCAVVFSGIAPDPFLAAHAVRPPAVTAGQALTAGKEIAFTVFIGVDVDGAAP